MADASRLTLRASGAGGAGRAGAAAAAAAAAPAAGDAAHRVRRRRGAAGALGARRAGHPRLLAQPPADAADVTAGQPVCIMVSQHRDGEIATGLLGAWGVATVRGSATRGAVGGFLRLVDAYRHGHNLAVLPDGPRGPRYVAKPGVDPSRQGGRRRRSSRWPTPPTALRAAAQLGPPDHSAAVRARGASPSASR